jgi:hypothetical protein
LTILTPPTYKAFAAPVTELPLVVTVEPKVTKLEFVVDETTITPSVPTFNCILLPPESSKTACGLVLPPTKPLGYIITLVGIK